MFTPDQYQLVDFGEGRRLERFGNLLLDRPAPAVEGLAKSDRQLWNTATARFERGDGDAGRWQSSHELPEKWHVGHGSLTLELKLTQLGQVGLFPEQAENWDWIGQQASRKRESDAPLRVLNLFAYTGGSTLAAACAGAEVTHVDAARNIVAWARHNAELSGLASAPIHWIVEDAAKFVKREIRRGNRYDAVILDPPSYGHGARGEVWRLANDLPHLLELCGELTAGRRQFILMTCHTPDFGPSRLRRMMVEALGPAEPGHLAAHELTIEAANGREFPCGVAVRLESGQWSL